MEGKVDWEYARQLHETGKSTREIARVVGCSQQAVVSKAKRAGWRNHLLGEARTQVLELQVDENARRVTGLGSTDSLEKLGGAVDERTELLRSHRNAWKRTVGHLQREIEAALTDKDWRPPPTWNGIKCNGPPDLHVRQLFVRELAKTQQLITQNLIIGQEGERRAHGFSFQMQQKEAAAQDHKAERRRELMAKVIKALESARVIERDNLIHETE